jgi:hypothetical protein
MTNISIQRNNLLKDICKKDVDFVVIYFPVMQRHARIGSSIPNRKG